MFDDKSFYVSNPFDDKVWPKSTSIVCYHCVHKFKGKPLSLPVQYDENKDTFKVTGNFCSWGCMKRYNFDLQDSKVNYRNNLIFLLYTKLTNQVKPIVDAPPKLALKIFGGKMNIDDFRKISKDNDCKYEILHNPLIPINPLIDKHINFAYVSTSDAEKSFDTFNTQVKDDPLKMKRTKASKNEQNTLEQTMGIISGN